MNGFRRSKIVFTFLGSFIGAGFATGREIALFFGTCGIFAPILAGVFSGLFCFLFLEIGRRNQDIVPALFPKTHRFFSLLIALANFCIFVAMVAGAEQVVYDTFSVRGGGFISALVCLSVSTQGKKGLQWLNTAVVPLLIFLIFLLVCKGKPKPTLGFSLAKPLLYAALNILSGGILVGGMAKENTKKDNVIIAITLSVLLSALLGGVYAVVSAKSHLEMPLLELAKELGLPVSGGTLIYFAILTTMAGSLSLASNDSLKKGVWLTVIAFPLSFLGFQPIVDATYPIIGGLGVLLTLSCIYQLIAQKIDAKKSSLSLENRT